MVQKIGQRIISRWFLPVPVTKGVSCKTLNNFWEPRQKPQCQENVVLLAVVSTSCKIIFMSTPFWLLWRQENLLLFPIVFWPPTKTILLIHHFGSQTWQSSMLDSLPAPSLLWCVKKLLHWNLCDVHWSSDSIILLIHAFLLLVWVSPFREDGRLYLSKKKKKDFFIFAEHLENVTNKVI